MSVPESLRHLRLPVIGAPMFIASGPELVIAQCGPASSARSPR